MGKGTAFLSSFIFNLTTSPAAAYRRSQASWCAAEGVVGGDDTCDETLDEPFELAVLPEGQLLDDQLPFDQLDGGETLT